MSRVLSVISAKGGVGKTSMSVNLAAALTKLGETPILVDANLLTPNVSIHLGIPNLPYSIHDVLSGKKSIKTAVFTHSTGIKVLPASLNSKDIRNANFLKLSGIMKQLRKEANIIIVDSPASITMEVQEIVRNSDEVIIVTNPELPAVSDSIKAIQLANTLKKPITAFIVNKKNFEEDIELSIPEIESLIERPVTACIPSDRAVKESLSQYTPVIFSHPNSKAAVQICKLAGWIAGLDYIPEPEVKKSFWARLFRR